MKYTELLITIVLWLVILHLDNGILPMSYADQIFAQNEKVEQQIFNTNPVATVGHEDSKYIIENSEIIEENKPFGFPLQKSGNSKKPCSIMVIANGQSSMQSLLRKYRYDANGALIPSSVKYYMKMPQDSGSGSKLVPLTGKAFSPLGGFVRYYKEVPPIPPSLEITAK